MPVWLDVLRLEGNHVHGIHVLSDGDGEVVCVLHENRPGLGDGGQDHSEGHLGFQA